MTFSIPPHAAIGESNGLEATRLDCGLEEKDTIKEDSLFISSAEISPLSSSVLSAKQNDVVD